MNAKHFYNDIDMLDISDELITKSDYDNVVIDEEDVKFNQLVFSPDPLTHNPQSEVAYMLSGADEGFKAFIKEKLFNPIPQGALADSVDESEQLVKKNVYTYEQFQQVCNEYVKTMMSQPVESKDE